MRHAMRNQINRAMVCRRDHITGHFLPAMVEQCPVQTPYRLGIGRNGTHIMGDKQDGHILVDLIQHFKYRAAHLRVHTGSGFIQQQNIRLRCQCPGNIRSLALAAGKLPNRSFALVKQSPPCARTRQQSPHRLPNNGGIAAASPDVPSRPLPIH